MKRLIIVCCSLFVLVGCSGKSEQSAIVPSKDPLQSISSPGFGTVIQFGESVKERKFIIELHTIDEEQKITSQIIATVDDAVRSEKGPLPVDSIGFGNYRDLEEDTTLYFKFVSGGASTTKQIHLADVAGLLSTSVLELDISKVDSDAQYILMEMSTDGRVSVNKSTLAEYTQDPSDRQSPVYLVTISFK